MRFANDCHGRLDYFFNPDGFVGRGRGRTDARQRAPGGARARPGEQEGNVHVDCGLRGQEWSGVGRRGGGETDSRRRRRRWISLRRNVLESHK